MRFGLSELSQIKHIEPKQTTYSFGTKEVNNLEMTSLSMISLKVRQLPQCMRYLEASGNYLHISVYLPSNLSACARLAAKHEVAVLDE